jgi:hypothetical protein
MLNVPTKLKVISTPSVSNQDILRNAEAQRKAAIDMVKLARKMKSEARRIQKQLRRTA